MRLSRAATRYRKTQAENDAARAELRDAMQAAHEAGMSMAAMARMLEVSRQRIREILKG